MSCHQDSQSDCVCVCVCVCVSLTYVTCKAQRAYSLEPSPVLSATPSRSSRKTDESHTPRRHSLRPGVSARTPPGSTADSVQTLKDIVSFVHLPQIHTHTHMHTHTHTHTCRHTRRHTHRQTHTMSISPWEPPSSFANKQCTCGLLFSSERKKSHRKHENTTDKLNDKMQFMRQTGQEIIQI